MRFNMKIKRIFAENYKSFEKLDVKLDDFTLIVGANAAGKSNLTTIFKFIKDIMIEGLDNAIALQGGIDYLANANSEKNKPIKLGFELDFHDKGWLMRGPNELMITTEAISYTFEFLPNKRGKNYQVSYDELKIKYGCVEKLKNNKNTRKIELKPLNISFSCIYKKKSAQSKYETIEDIPEELTKKSENIKLIFRHADFLLEDLYREKKELLLYRLSFFLPPLISEENLIKIYDFDPKKLKRPCMISARKNLEVDGSNLAAALQIVLKSKEKYNKFIGLLKNALPFINKISVEQNYDQSYSYKIAEDYSTKSFYSNFLSDGTVSIIAIIIALYFEEKSTIIIIEEPERNIHPKLLSTVVQMAKDVSKNKQVIFTTHNPEILSNADLENIRFVQRDKQGYSVVTSPADSDRVKAFINNELGLNDLFLQNLLGD